MLSNLVRLVRYLQAKQLSPMHAVTTRQDITRTNGRRQYIFFRLVSYLSAVLRLTHRLQKSQCILDTEHVQCQSDTSVMQRTENRQGDGSARRHRNR